MAATILASSQLDKEVSVTRKKRQMLKEYYGMVDEDDRGMAFNNSCPPLLNIDGSSFSPDMYLTKLKRDLCLKDLMDSEQNMVKKINSLASEKHNLVYNNYNKFISATDTIRKMKNDFKKMEDEMDRLATNMEAITEFSAKISNTLQDRRQQISKLSGVHSLLKKLQFLFELPAILNKCIESQAYSQAVRYYTKAQRVLYQYQHLPSFHGIQEDCTNIVAELKMKLRDQFKNKKSNPKLLAECIDLLLQLQEPPEELCDEFLSHAKQKIDEDLVLLSNQLKLLKGEPLQKSSDEFERPAEAYLNAPMDILEFIDCGCNGFLSNICLVIASYNDMFLNRQIGSELESMDTIALRKLVNFVMALMERYFNYVEQRVQLERETGDNTILVRALDRFHRRLQAMNKLLPDTDFARTGTDIVSHAAQDRCAHYLDTLKQHFTDCLTDVRHSLAAPKHLTQQDNSNLLNDLLVSMEASVVEQLNSVLANLQAFIHPDITFAMKPYFRGPFCKQHVREDLVVTFFRHITTVSLEFCDGLVEKSSPSPTLILLLSRLCLNFSNSTISSLLTLADEQLMLEDKINLTPESDLCKESKETAQKLLNSFVRIQGLTISQMLRKSVEIRDWLNTIEPRNVRGVMKRVVEDITAIDSQVGQLYEKGICKEHSSDSSKRTGFSYSLSRQQQKSTWSNYTPSTLDNSLMSNIQKLFSEKIEIFSSVEFSKMSVLTGIIKISLKTFLECVRLRTFSRYGLQQVQVDTHYLQLYLWRFVSDENLVHVLLDEIVASSANRCLDPQMMEFSVVELICERG